MNTVAAQITRTSLDDYRFIIPAAQGMPRVEVALIQRPGGFIPASKPRGFADLDRVSWEPGGEMKVHYTDGMVDISRRTSNDVWKVDAPIPPPPTLAAIGDKLQLRNTTTNHRLTFTVHGPATWTVTKSGSLSVARIVSGHTLQITSSATAGNHAVTVTIKDQWGRTASRSLRVYVPRLPTLAAIGNITLESGKANSRRISYTKDPRSGGPWVTATSARPGLASVTITGSGALNVRVQGSASLSGSTTITVRVRDQWNQTASRSFKVTVKPKPKPVAVWRWPFGRADLTPGRMYWVPPGHNGIDFGYGRAQGGAPIRAAGPGTVTFKGWEPNGWGGGGNMIIVDHGDGYETGYAHMQSFGNVNVGSRVDSNTVIGYVGTTGNSTGNHLHFQVQNSRGWNTRDPIGYMNSKGATGW